MKRVSAIVRPERLDSVTAALEATGLHGFTITDVRGHGQSPEAHGEYRGRAFELHVTHKIQVDLIVDDDEVDQAVRALIAGGRTGSVGDGLITVSEIAAVYQIRTAVPSGAAAAANGTSGSA